ncbi:hypothetical protein PV08_03323 [Exophiala spinifera]|uniref:Uncharacterized protein n=1 Tax=Exophiala spinifera TaxID=91928 RepID=A0A0D2BJG6_9EURO|nr:uncharacterized protein PV08_03323 [Exophiala spinifera]KIW19033.1 hypothetical protein PV08_03323 [Exophiala spinifera]
MAATMTEEVTKKLEVRLLFNDTVTTESFLIPASEAPTLNDLYAAIHKRVDVGVHGLFNFFELDRPGLYVGSLYPALFLVQENSTNKHAVKHWRWTTLTWGHWMEYRRWYERNVQGSNPGDNLKVEMKLNMTRDKAFTREQEDAYVALTQKITDAGMGEDDLEWQAPPSMLKLDDVNNRKVWEWHPAHAQEGTINYVSIDAVPATDDWFPMRDPVSPLVTNGTCKACLKVAKELEIPKMGKKAIKKAKAKAKRDAAEAAAAAAAAAAEEAGVAGEGEEIDEDAMMDIVEEMEGEDGAEDEEEEEEAGGPDFSQPLALRPKDDDSMEID